MIPSPVDGYRMRARLHLRRGRIGFFREGTHELCEPRHTRQLLPESVGAVRELAAGLASVDAGLEGEVDLSENVPANERAFHLEVTRGGVGSRLGSHLGAIDGFTGGSFSIGGEAKSRELWGSPLVTDTLTLTGEREPRTMTLVRHARAFFQGNRFLLERLVELVRSAIAPGSVLDLYAGVGLFSISAAMSGLGETLAIEGDEVAAANLRRNAAQCAGKVRVRSESVENFFAGSHSRVSPSTVIVDPPRTGISKAAIQGVLRLQAPRLVYVSCDIATLARDARLFRESGYEVDEIRAFDLFPQTAHVETSHRVFTVAAFTNPSKRDRNSPVRQKFSGCHCTATQKPAPGRSIASMTPSGAVAVTSKPSATLLDRLMVAAVHLAHLASSMCRCSNSKAASRWPPRPRGRWRYARLSHRVVQRRR